MSVDGTKIIDGDTAHDTYWGMIDLYDIGIDFETIYKKFPPKDPEFYDDFDNEIYVTSWALATWEMGQMTDEKLAFVKAIIDKGACVKEWGGSDSKDGKARKQVLLKFWNKISQPNAKIRGRKKYKRVKNLYFQVDDVLTFKLKDANYRAMICSEIRQYRGNCYYYFVPTMYNADIKPTIEAIKNCEILGHEIGSGYEQHETKKRQPGIERIWEFVGKKCNFFFGLVVFGVDHKRIINFKDSFEKVGSIRIADGLKRTGSFSYKEDYEGFEEVFGKLENQIKIFKYRKYPVSILCSN